MPSDYVPPWLDPSSPYYDPTRQQYDDPNQTPTPPTREPWDPPTYPTLPPASTPTTPSTPAAPATSGGGGGGQQQMWADINGVANAPDYSFFEPAPEFNGPTFSYQPWQAPTGESVLSDPGYRFRMQQGEQALQQSAAAKGILRTGGTLKDILGWGQNFASQEYQNAYSRARNDYDTGFNQAQSAYQSNYNAAKDSYAPKMSTWEAKMNLGQRAADLSWGRAWDKYQYTHPDWRGVFDQAK